MSEIDQIYLDVCLYKIYIFKGLDNTKWQAN